MNVLIDALGFLTLVDTKTVDNDLRRYYLCDPAFRFLLVVRRGLTLEMLDGEVVDAQVGWDEGQPRLTHYIGRMQTKVTVFGIAGGKPESRLSTLIVRALRADDPDPDVRRAGHIAPRQREVASIRWSARHGHLTIPSSLLEQLGNPERLFAERTTNGLILYEEGDTRIKPDTVGRKVNYPKEAAPRLGIGPPAAEGLGLLDGFYSGEIAEGAIIAVRRRR